MDLKGLYELHDRLEAVAVAGVNLAGEDFRLKRAVEGIEPLAKASPVIKKLYVMAQNLLSDGCKDRAACLLDTLALSQALLCTQAGYGADPGEELKPLAAFPRPHSACQPYSAVKPLEEALTSTGGGRYSLVEEAVKEHPEKLEDYRIQNALVDSLSDHYADIAKLTESYLSKQDESFVPLLKHGFDKAPESGKIHRMRAVSSIAKEKENDFYIEILEHSKKELRSETIRALRFHKGNTGRLIDLLNTEKDLCLDMVKQSMAFIGVPEADRCLEKLFKEDPMDMARHIRFSTTDILSDCLAEKMEAMLDEYDEAQGNVKKEWLEDFEILFQALPGKASEAAQKLYCRAAGAGSLNRSLYLKFPDMLVKSMLYSGDNRLVDLARKLASSEGKWWNAPAFAADLLIDTAAGVFEDYQKAFPKDGLLGRKETRASRAAMMAVFGRINYEPDASRQEMADKIKGYGGEGKSYFVRRRLVESLDPRWYELLTDGRISGEETAPAIDRLGREAEMTYDQILFKLLPPEQKQQLGSYFYKQAKKAKDNRNYYSILIQCGCRDFTGLVLQYVKNNPDLGITIWMVSRLLAELPMDEETRKQEIRQIDRFICGHSKQSPVRRNWDSNANQRRIINQLAGMEETEK